MKLSEIKSVLVERDIRLTKSLGQNFLHDGNQLRRIIEAAKLKKADQVLEIGPGLGALTEFLVRDAGEVLAIEKDARLATILTERLQLMAPGTSVARILHEDALDFLRRDSTDWTKWKLVANLPYSVASPILVELAQAKGRPVRMVTTLQIEVAKRLMAKPDSADYGVLTVLMQAEYEPQGWFRIPASCFFPEPDIDSACVCLVRRDPPLLAPGATRAFARIVKRSFSQRRKTMLKLLKQDWSEEELAPVFEKLRLPLKIRAESVGLEQFVELTRLLGMKENIYER